MPRQRRFQLVPTVNGKDPVTKAEVQDAGRRAGGDANVYGAGDVGKYVRMWRIGIVSQAAYEPPTKANIKLAMHDSQQRTHLPQIEVLMI